MSKEFGFQYSYQFLTSFFGYRNAKKENKAWQIEDLTNMGNMIVRGIHELANYENDSDDKKN